MSFQRIHQSISQDTQTLSSTSQFAPRPFPVEEPKRPSTQEDIENEAFQQNKFEAFGLQLKEKHRTITPVEQEKLEMLQAKMDSFWAQRMERAKAQPNLLEILIRNAQSTQATEPVASVQPKLAIGQPNDQYEQEADRVADQVMSMPDSAVQQPVQREAMPEDEGVQTKPLAASITPLVQREAMPEAEEPVQAKAITDTLQHEAMPEEEDVQMKPSLQRKGDGSLQAGGNLESQLNSSKGRGSPLPEEVRTFMEPRFGADFSQVRVHTGSEAIQMNQDLNAHAFTHKQDVYFGAGKTPGKDALTAHELTHIVQQSGAAQTKQDFRQPNVQPKCLACEEDEHQLRRKESGDKPSKCTPTPHDPFCLGIPEPNAPCKPFSRLEQAEAAWDALSVQVPLLTANLTGCSEVKPVWESYFARTSTPFSFSNPSSCVVSAAKTDKEGSNTANSASKSLLGDIIDYLPITLLGVNLSPFPLNGLLAERRLPLEEAIAPHGARYLHPDITYNYPFNAAANIAGGMGIGGQGSDMFGDDDRVIGGTVIIEVHKIDPTGMMAGQVRWQPHIHVKDTVDFCPGNMGNSTQHQFTVPMSKLESMGLTKDVPITIDYDLELQQASFNVLRASGPPKPVPPQPVPPQPVPPRPNSQFSSRRFIGQPTLEACGAAKHRMLRGESDFEAVKKVQETLVEAGIPTEVTGIYSENTKRAVAKFKREHNPQIVPSDGVVGPKTSHALDEVAVEHGH
jgi:peptidoglycan hydrolase-like protein with peptidoglycan-binding domain/LysM repeat protein